MEWLNYHHLLYFWLAAREGSITRAAGELRRSQPTVSAQIGELERALGANLFVRIGRSLALTDTGRLVFRYADEIFSLGRELRGVLQGRSPGRPLRFVVGIADVLPKLVAHRLLEPAVRLPEPMQIVCREDRPDRLLTALSLHELDVVLSDAPANPAVPFRTFSRLLGECGVTFFGVARYASRRRGFPKSLDGAPILVPTEASALRRSLDQWFASLEIRPRIYGVFDDSALLKVFGEAGAGIFAAPSVIEAQVRHSYRVQTIGRTDAVRERFYAISVERKLQHPAVLAISEAAKHRMFLRKRRERHP